MQPRSQLISRPTYVAAWWVTTPAGATAKTLRKLILPNTKPPKPEVGQYEVPGENTEDFGSLMQARHPVCI